MKLGEEIILNPNGFIWPIPGYNKISSYFGKRVSPTSGASSSHSGIDIPAPEGTKFIAVNDGTITFRNFLGAGGYTITLSFNDFKVSYCHSDPNFIVELGQEVKQGQVIGKVGPKNVYGVPGNQYKDNLGNPTNGATTGTHLHLGIRINRKISKSIRIFLKSIKKNDITNHSKKYINLFIKISIIIFIISKTSKPRRRNFKIICYTVNCRRSNIYSFTICIFPYCTFGSKT